MANAVSVCSLLFKLWLLPALEAAKVSPLIEKVGDHKDFKKLLRTRTNVLVLYTKSGWSGSNREFSLAERWCHGRRR